MRVQLSFFLFLLTPNMCLADSYMCAADAGAFVEDGAAKPASSAVADVSDSKYVVTRMENGGWGVKPLGYDYFLFDHCIISNQGEPAFCEQAGEMFAGSFLMGQDRKFSVLWMTQVRERDRWVVAKGRCSKI